MAVTNKGAGQGQGSGAGGQGAGGRGLGAGGRGPGAGDLGISPGYLYNEHDLQLLSKKTRGEKNIKSILVYCISQTT